MECKEFRNAILAKMKQELKDFAQIQKNLKKSRKLEFRPKDRSLQSICDEISNNAYKIQQLLFYYTWLKHGKKYWANRGIDSYWKYYCSEYNTLSKYPEDYENQNVYWAKNEHVKGMYNTYGEYVGWLLTEFIICKMEDYDLSYEDDLKEFINK